MRTYEVQLHVIDSLRSKLLCVIIRLVQAHHQSDILALKIRDVIFWPKIVIATGTALALCVRACEGKEPAFHAPVQITILRKENVK